MRENFGKIKGRNGVVNDGRLVKDKFIKCFSWMIIGGSFCGRSRHSIFSFRMRNIIVGVARLVFDLLGLGFVWGYNSDIIINRAGLFITFGWGNFILNSSFSVRTRMVISQIMRGRRCTRFITSVTVARRRIGVTFLLVGSRDSSIF